MFINRALLFTCSFVFIQVIRPGTSGLSNESPLSGVITIGDGKVEILTRPETEGRPTVKLFLYNGPTSSIEVERETAKKLLV